MEIGKQHMSLLLRISGCVSTASIVHQCMVAATMAASVMDVCSSKTYHSERD